MASRTSETETLDITTAFYGEDDIENLDGNMRLVTDMSSQFINDCTARHQRLIPLAKTMSVNDDHYLSITGSAITGAVGSLLAAEVYNIMAFSNTPRGDAEAALMSAVDQVFEKSIDMMLAHLDPKATPASDAPTGG